MNRTLDNLYRLIAKHRGEFRRIAGQVRHRSLVDCNGSPACPLVAVCPLPGTMWNDDFEAIARELHADINDVLEIAGAADDCNPEAFAYRDRLHLACFNVKERKAVRS